MHLTINIITIKHHIINMNLIKLKFNKIFNKMSGYISKKTI